ncbi:MAG: hypothetical protein IT305_14105 [Chloroflexi bacterium]|nr:hypothetical protein [Chloroflexota bacterium]
MSRTAVLPHSRTSRREQPTASWSADWRAIVLVGLATLVAIVPAWKPEWYQDDQLPMLFRSLHTDLAHHWGILYPRLAPELGFGYGRLLHQFYPPFGIELAVWLHTLGLGYIDAARATYSLCLLASAAGMYAYARAVLGAPLRAAVAAIAYVWAPYVLLDAHKGGVLGESVALAIMPWSMLAVHRLVVSGGWAMLAAVSISLGTIVLGHNITALFFIGLIGAYAALLAAGSTIGRPSGATTGDPGGVAPGSTLGTAVGLEQPDTAKIERRQRLRVALGGLMRAAAAMVLGLGLAAVYWLPALTELSASNVSSQRKGAFSVGRYLVELPNLLQGSLVFDYYGEAVPHFGLTIGVLTLLASILVLAALAIGRRQALASGEASDSPAPLPLVAFVVCIVGVLALQLEPSLVLWETIPLISFIQFPQRLFVFGSFAGAVVLGALPWAVTVLADRRGGYSAMGADQSGGLRGRRAWLGIATAAALIVTLGATSLPGIFWTWPIADSHRISEEQVGIGTQADRRLSERSAFDDYFPVWVEEESNLIARPPSPTRAEVYAEVSPHAAPATRLVERGYYQTTVEADAAEPTSLVLHAFYFPGWQATADGQPLLMEPVGPLGLVRVEVPPGHHTVIIRFGETPIRTVAAAVSLATVVVVVGALAAGVGASRALLGLAALALVVGVPRLLHAPHGAAVRPPAQEVGADVLPSARILTVERTDRPVRAGETVPITLVWQATAYSPNDYQSGVRMTRADGTSVVAERWGRPNRERTPTGKWLVGEIVPDTLLLRIPQGTPPGRYRLFGGLRDADERERAPVHLAALGEIEIR